MFVTSKEQFKWLEVDIFENVEAKVIIIFSKRSREVKFYVKILKLGSTDYEYILYTIEIHKFITLDYPF